MKYIKVIDLLRHRLLFVPHKEEYEVNRGDRVLIKKEQDVTVGKVLDIVLSLKGEKEDVWEFEKKLTPDEIRDYEALQIEEKNRVSRAQAFSNELQLGMRFFASRVGWERKIISFFFTCEESVDFREFLKRLAGEMKCRIHLERVGPRDKARIIGGFGVCGQETCCSTFRSQLVSVPMDAVRDQGVMIKDNNKLLGGCGKLKCCFLYELPIYREMRKTLPHLRQSVLVKGKQVGRVIGLDILNQKVKVLFSEADFSEVFEATDVRPCDNTAATVKSTEAQ